MHEKTPVGPLPCSGETHFADNIEQLYLHASLNRRIHLKCLILVTRLIGVGFAVSALTFQANPASAQSVKDLRDLSIEELANIQISPVSKSVEPLSDAPAEPEGVVYLRLHSQRHRP